MIPNPSEKEVDKYLYKWEHLDEHYICQESSLNKLILNDYKDNTDLNEILIKCCVINDFYSTNIFYIYPVAKKIFDLKIDKRLKEGDPTLVNEIATIDVANKTRYFYSFASKYCSHHNNMEYPIYDSFVEKMLWHFEKQDHFYGFKRDELKDYVIFKNVLIAFKKYYHIDGYNLRDIDKYLWLAGKDYFPKKY